MSRDVLEPLAAASPFAAAIAASPVAISTMLVLLVGPRRRAHTRAFLTVWVVGIAGAMLAAVAWLPAPVVARAAAEDPTRGGPIDLGVGALLLALAGVALARARLAAGRPALVTWVGRCPPLAVAGIAAVFACNPVHLALTAAAVRAADATPAGATGVTGPGGLLVAGYTAIASAPLLVAAAVPAALPSSAEGALRRAEGWLAVRGDAVAAVVFVVIGAWSLTRGLR